MKNIHGLEIGDKALRLKWREHVGWTWQKFEVTYSYLWLIQEFPEEYKPL